MNHSSEAATRCCPKKGGIRFLAKCLSLEKFCPPLPRKWGCSLLVGVSIMFGLCPNGMAIGILWDYTYDTSGFFTQERRDVLTAVSVSLSGYGFSRPELYDSDGDGDNEVFSIWINNPNDETNAFWVDSPTIGADTIRVFVGADSFDVGTTLAQTSTATIAKSGETIESLLTTYDTNTAVNPIAGTISFNSDKNWFSGLAPIVPAEQFSFFSIASHELGHILGFGNSNAWKYNTWTDGDGNNFFFGEAGCASFGSDIPLTIDFSHFSQTTGFLMAPAIGTGTLVEWSETEKAIFRDLGYFAIPIPEPNLGLWSLAGLLVITMGRCCRLKARKK